ncbi:MAG TPA: hypothetical protein P5132_02900 [Bacteroidales bacterium]|nr:hypothetical protein [Bacteroidales bacterium]
MHLSTNKKILIAIAIFLLIDVLLKLVYKYYIINTEILIQYYHDQFSELSAELKIKSINQNLSIKLLFAETFIVFKMILISGIIKLGIFLFNYKSKTSFKKILYVVIKSYFIFLIPGIIQILWFSIFKENYSVDDLMNFNWHTLLFWIDDLKYDFLRYPLSVINLYEILFWILLILLLKKQLGKSLWVSSKLVLTTYILGLFTWIVFVVFIIVVVAG